MKASLRGNFNTDGVKIWFDYFPFLPFILFHFNFILPSFPISFPLSNTRFCNMVLELSSAYEINLSFECHILKQDICKLRFTKLSTKLNFWFE